MRRRITEIFESADAILTFCRHRNLSRLFTIEAKTYKVCMDCSRQVLYSRETMLPLGRRELRPKAIDRAAAGGNS
jgi:mRNA degradation ribonuclease J1/J2